MKLRIQYPTQIHSHGINVLKKFLIATKTGNRDILKKQYADSSRKLITHWEAIHLHRYLVHVLTDYSKLKGERGGIKTGDINYIENRARMTSILKVNGYDNEVSHLYRQLPDGFDIEVGENTIQALADYQDNICFLECFTRFLEYCRDEGRPLEEVFGKDQSLLRTTIIELNNYLKSLSLTERAKLNIRAEATCEESPSASVAHIPVHTPSSDTLTEEFLNKLAEDYYPRGEALRQINQVIKAASHGYITVQGAAGGGKSAILADVGRRYRKNEDYDCVIHCIRWQRGNDRCTDFFRNLYNQLGRIYSLRAKHPDTIEHYNYATWLEDLLCEVSEFIRIKSGKKLIIVIDGLDEIWEGDVSNKNPNDNFFFLPNRVHENIIFVTSCRYDGKQRSENREKLLLLKVNPEEKHQEDEVRGYIKTKLTTKPVDDWLREHSKTPNQFVDLLVEKSRCSFNYLHFLFQPDPSAPEGKSIMDLERFDEDSMPLGIEGYYDDQLDRLNIQETPEKLSVFILLCLFKPDLSLARLHTMSGVEPIQINHTITPWVKLRHIEQHPKDSQFYYGLEHPSFYRHLIDNVVNLHVDNNMLASWMLRLEPELLQTYPIIDDKFIVPKNEDKSKVEESIRIIPQILTVSNPGAAANYMVNRQFCEKYFKMDFSHARLLVALLADVYVEIWKTEGEPIANNMAYKFADNIVSKKAALIAEADWSDFSRNIMHNPQKRFADAVNKRISERKS